MEPVTIHIGDGYLFISMTAECMHYVEYENHLAPADKITYLNFENLEMVISREWGDTPDTLFIFDTVTKASYSLTVDDGATGWTCIPWPLMG